MPRTGGRCMRVGIYASDCGSQWTVEMGLVYSEFPTCPHCNRAVNFTYVGPLP